jgi:hypothetical protein
MDFCSGTPMHFLSGVDKPFLDVRAAVLNGTFEGSFRRRYPDFRPANTNHQTIRAA